MLRRRRREHRGKLAMGVLPSWMSRVSITYSKWQDNHGGMERILATPCTRVQGYRRNSNSPKISFINYCSTVSSSCKLLNCVLVSSASFCFALLTPLSVLSLVYILYSAHLLVLYAHVFCWQFDIPMGIGETLHCCCTWYIKSLLLSSATHTLKPVIYRHCFGSWFRLNGTTDQLYLAETFGIDREFACSSSKCGFTAESGQFSAPVILPNDQIRVPGTRTTVPRPRNSLLFPIGNSNSPSRSMCYEIVPYRRKSCDSAA